MTDYFIHDHLSLIRFCLWIIFRFVLINADVINRSGINLSVALSHSVIYIYWEYGKALHFAEGLFPFIGSLDTPSLADIIETGVAIV